MSEGRSDVSPFERAFFSADGRVSRIGPGALGGKASGLLLARDAAAQRLMPGSIPGAEIVVPSLAVVATGVFDAFVQRNRLEEVALSGEPDDAIARAFLHGDVPAEIVGDLRALVEEVKVPLAARSSSLLEDAREHPFAGVYATKMIPNDSPSPDERFRRLVEAIKLVWASTFFRVARSYRESVGAGAFDEKMAVVLQEVVGRRHGERFYPDLSGVARSWAFYRAGRTRPEDGVVQLALGLGKTVVDGDPTWIYAPPYPKAPPPYGSVSELVRETQTSFWAVRFGKPPAWDPVHEAEYLVKAGLAEAEEDGTLRPLASTYDGQSDRLVPGISVPGPRVVNFAPLLVHEQAPLNASVRAALSACEESAGGAVEMEFAATLEPGSETPLRLCILQVREMAFSSAAVEVSATLEGFAPLVLSDAVLGNGMEESVADVVFVKPGVFEQRNAPLAAEEVAALCRPLREARRPFLLIGYGRWGSSDPWLGIPVGWGDVAGARAIVEATLPGRPVEMSQGSHFFHNLAAFGVSYFSVPSVDDGAIDWGWLERQEVTAERTVTRHVRIQGRLRVEIDGRTGHGAIWRPRDG
ncbi:MAG TPA: PEP/pyruvate-binding domain-containing protein [Thermoanaerobaculia bacterium]|nr:PEP/pyruvate-binding domain-containing protein [Thermoanaerobaculia bacterium]